MLLYVSRRGDLVRTDGRRAQTIGPVPAGLGRWFEIAPLPSGRIAFAGRRVAVLAADGTLVAADRPRWSGMPTESPDGAVATISIRHSKDYARAREAVRLLRPGARSSTLLFLNEFGPVGCGHSPSLSWQGDSLLYSTTEAKVVVLDADSGDDLDLSRVVARLPGHFLTAGWA
jgi:hypothetical protein